MELTVPVWEKIYLTPREASLIFNIGEHKVRSIVKSGDISNATLSVGNRDLIHKKSFEKYLLARSEI